MFLCSAGLSTGWIVAIAIASILLVTAMIVVLVLVPFKLWFRAFVSSAHISMIKLGIDEGIIEGENINPIELLISAQPYMLMKNCVAQTPSERDEARAKMIRDLL